MTESKTTKRALAASIGCMALCVVLLIGTTFAWFTDTASTSVNKIQSGTLDVALVDASGAELTGGLTFQKAAGNETETVLWEPGATYNTNEFYVKNNGSLALKYKLSIDGVDGDTGLLKAIDFSVIDKDGYAVDLSTFEGHLTAKGTDNCKSGAYKIKAHMKEDAGNEYQGKTLEGIKVSVTATQDAVEYDSTSKEYDKKAEYATPVASATDLVAAIADGGDIVLAQDVVMDQRLSITGDTTIYGNGTSKISVADSLKDNRVVTVNDNTAATTLTLSGVTIDGTNVERGLSVFTNSDLDIVVDNSSVSAKYPFSLGNDNTNLELNVSNSTLTGYGVLNNFAPGANATFENCTLIGNNMWSGIPNDFATIVINNDVTYGTASNTTLTFKDCRIEAKEYGDAYEYFLSARAPGAKVTFENCTFVHNDKVLTSETDILSHMQLAADAVVTFK